MPRQSEEADAYKLDVWQRTETIAQILEMDGVPTDILSGEAMLQLAAHILSSHYGDELAAQAFEIFAKHVRENKKVKW